MPLRWPPLTRLLTALLLFATPLTVQAEAQLHIGVLAVRPKDQAMAQWQPLAAYLQQALGQPVSLAVYDYAELEQAVAQGAINAVLTNSGHYVLLKHRKQASSPLATRIVREGKHSLTGYGGLIVARAERSDIETLGDLADKRIATVDSKAFAGYSMPAFEMMQAGLPQPRPEDFLATGMPHDRVVYAVLEGRADVGFVRSGVLESMIHEGRIDPARIKIINRLAIPDFPYASSTQLYPEWPVVVTPAVPESLARGLAVALLSLPADSAAARSVGIQGFTVPANYDGVEEVLRRLRQPPFDAPPDFTLADLWLRHTPWVILTGSAILVLALLGSRLALQNWRIRRDRQRLATLFEQSPEPVWIFAEDRFVDCNRAAMEILGYPDKRPLLQIGPAGISPERQPDGADSQTKGQRLIEAVLRGEPQRFEWVHLRADGSELTVVVSLGPITLSGKPAVLGIWHDITDRKRIEQALVESEARFRHFFEKNRSVMLLIEPNQGTIIAANQAASDYYGYPLGQLVGATTSKINQLTPEQAAAERQLALHEERNSFNFVHRLASGELRDVELYATPVNIREQTLLFCIIHDVTARQRAEAALRDSERDAREQRQRFVEVLWGTNAGAWEWNFQTETLVIDSRWAEIAGYRLEELTPTRIEMAKELIHPQDLERAERLLEPCFRRETESFECELRLRRKDGDWVWVLDRGRVVEWSDDGQPVRMSGTRTDITARKNSEARLQLAASVFTHAWEGIMITDAEGVIVEVNDAFSRITGYSRDEVLGKTPALLKSGRQPPEFYQAMWQALTTSDHWDGEVWNRRRGGELYAEMLTISAVRDEQGRTRNYVAQFTDITQSKAYQQQLERIAHFDPLTQLPNRTLFSDRLGQALAQCRRRNGGLAVAYIDLDGFKEVNDRHGHEVGDHLLTAVAQRMERALREGDTLARVGGDEFVALLVDFEGSQLCELVLNRLLLGAAEPVWIGATTVQVSASIGVAIYPQDGTDGEQLVRHADRAMYVAKQSGKNRCHRFEQPGDGAEPTASINPV